MYLLNESFVQICAQDQFIFQTATKLLGLNIYILGCLDLPNKLNCWVFFGLGGVGRITENRALVA